MLTRGFEWLLFRSFIATFPAAEVGVRRTRHKQTARTAVCEFACDFLSAVWQTSRNSGYIARLFGGCRILEVHSSPLNLSRLGGATVADSGIAGLLERLRTSDPLPAWEVFLDQYSPALFQAARASTCDTDSATECYLYICEQLALRNFRRLLKFKPTGPASFKTWLQVVARNLCMDWHRKRTGRRRPFKSIQSLSELEFQVYVCRFERGLSAEETLQHLRPVSPQLDLGQVEHAEQRIEHSLSSRQRWMLSMRQNRSPATITAVLSDEAEEAVSQIPDVRLDQETLVMNQQQHAQMMNCMKRLPKHERLLLQLRFEEDLSLEEIARLTGQGDAQRVHRQIAAVLKKLRSAME